MALDHYILEELHAGGEATAPQLRSRLLARQGLPWLVSLELWLFGPPYVRLHRLEQAGMLACSERPRATSPPPGWRPPWVEYVYRIKPSGKG